MVSPHSLLYRVRLEERGGPAYFTLPWSPDSQIHVFPVAHCLVLAEELLLRCARASTCQGRRPHPGLLQVRGRDQEIVDARGRHAGLGGGRLQEVVYVKADASLH